MLDCEKICQFTTVYQAHVNEMATSFTFASLIICASLAYINVELKVMYMYHKIEWNYCVLIVVSHLDCGVINLFYYFKQSFHFCMNAL